MKNLFVVLLSLISSSLSVIKGVRYFHAHELTVDSLVFIPYGIGWKQPPLTDVKNNRNPIWIITGIQCIFLDAKKYPLTLSPLLLFADCEEKENAQIFPLNIIEKIDKSTLLKKWNKIELYFSISYLGGKYFYKFAYNIVDNSTSQDVIMNWQKRGNLKVIYS